MPIFLKIIFKNFNFKSGISIELHIKFYFYETYSKTSQTYNNSVPINLYLLAL